MMGRVEELLVAEELWNDHKKLIFFPFSSAATCTNRPLEVDQSGLNTGFLEKWDFFNPEEVQLGQFRAAIAQFRIVNPVKTPLQVDFATLQMPEIAFLPKLHFLLMDSEVGPIIFERFSRVMARIFVQKGAPLIFHRFLFREYQRGYVKSSVLAPLLAESEIFVNSDWCKAYPVAELQLENLNSSLYKSNQLTLTPEKFMDLNSINLVSDPYSTWVEKYKIYVALQKDLLAHNLHHPLSIDKFLQHASF
ncbi:hypothetical protein Taro_000187 [Colocasia esculenta]|uniref:Uncharacterized protein n=1 Tax=Colocasia esculenta TaxID=4460 RepID=A0A843TFV4_COLES|nr:hypothetical protein [Colocasia esculenta]